MERVYFVESNGQLIAPPQPIPGAFDRLAPFRRQLRRHLPCIHRMAAEKFVEHYDGRRKTVYAEAVESLSREGVQRKDSFMSTFVKAEKINFSSKPDPAPRVIQPRHPRYNVEVGRFIVPIEKLVYRGIGKVWGGPTVMKGYNAHGTATELRAMWESFVEPVAVGLDASRFDQHVSVPALEWEHKVYLDCYSGDEKTLLAKLLGWQLRNTGYGRASDGAIKYVKDGCRMSGDMNTALGNCLLMSAMVWAYCDQLSIKARLANNGDDCVVVLEKADLSRFMSGLTVWFNEMGFTMKVEAPVFVFEQIEFCQTHPVWTPDGWVMCRDPRVCCSKDVVSVLPLYQGSMRYGLLTSVGECGLSLCGGLPVLQAFYLAMLRNGRGKRLGKHPALESGFARLATGMSRKVGLIHPQTRYSFWLAFGITPDVQAAVEAGLCLWELGTDICPRETDIDHIATCVF